MGNLIRLVLLLILINCLSSCRGYPDINRKLYVEQCSPYFEVDHYGNIDIIKSFCLCRKYKYSLEYMGGIENSTLYKPLIYCNKLIGNKTKDYLNLVNFLGDVKREIQEHINEEKE